MRDATLALALGVALGGCKNTVIEGSGGSSATLTGGGGSQGGSGAGGTGPGGSTTSQGGSTSTAECTLNIDCEGTPDTPYCDFATGKCVECLPSIGCLDGGVCDPATLTCKCDSDFSCFGDKPACDTASGECVGCLPGGNYCGAEVCNPDTLACVECLPGSGSCGPEEVCDPSALVCVPECGPELACSAGLSCCGGVCRDLATDVQNCGVCDIPCPPVPGVAEVCSGGVCAMGGCEPNFGDCDGLTSNGCEQNTLVDGPCVCQPGSTQACYQGMPGTEGVGPCKGGVRTCDASGAGFGPCVGQVLPVPEICVNGVDDNCDGVVDVTPDSDGDGWTACDGDCNDLNPKVNPGALEITWGFVDDDNDPFTKDVLVPGIGNGLDDDCDPATPDVGIPAGCSDVAITSNVTPMDLAHALDLCQSAQANAPLPERTWGVLSAEFHRPDGAAVEAAQLADMANWQSAVLTSYGSVVPKGGATMMGLSTGRMRAPGQAGYVVPSPGSDLGWTGSPPAAYLAQHGGNLVGSTGCSGACPSGAGAFDGISLRVSLRAPTNMTSFSFDYRMFSAEFPGNVCSAKNDHFLLLDTSTAPGLPPDKNIVFDVMGNPMSVNNLFFEACVPTGCFTCPGGTGSLAGTGMPAASSFLTMDAPYTPGETLTLEFMVFDVGDGAGDTVALVDNFRFRHFDPYPCEWCID